MKRTMLILLSICSLSLFAQDLDEVFDDGDKDSKFHIGTDLVTMCTGTINAYVDFNINEAVTLQGGIGMVPFSKFIDLMNWRPGSSDHLPVVDSAVTFGSYFNAAIKIYHGAFTQSDFGVYYYVDFKRWKYGAQTDFKVTRLKGNVGMGYNISLVGRLNLDIQFGVYLGLDKMTVNSDYTIPPFFDQEVRSYNVFEGQEKYSRLINGFDLGIGLNFAL